MAGRQPEVCPVRFEDAGAGADLTCQFIRPQVSSLDTERTHYISTPELLVCLIEHIRQIIPDGHVRLDEYGACFAAIFCRVLLYQLLRFVAQGEVGDKDVAVAGEEEFSEAEVYA